MLCQIEVTSVKEKKKKMMMKQQQKTAETGNGAK